MQIDWPKISIVTPNYNQGRYIEKAICSVLDQGYPNLEYLIIDGGSTDESVSVIERYSSRIDYWVSEKDRGQSHAINKGLARTNGELLGWLNADDYLLPGALEKLARAYMEDREVGAVYGQGHIVDESGKIVYTPKLTQVTLDHLYDWCYGNDFMQPSCLFSRKAWDKCGPLDESIHISMDVDLWLKIASKYRFKRLPDVLSHSLTHPDAKTTAFRNLMRVDLALVVERHGGDAAARRILEDQANRLSERDAFYAYFGGNILLKAVRKFVCWQMARRLKITQRW